MSLWSTLPGLHGAIADRPDPEDLPPFTLYAADDDDPATLYMVNEDQDAWIAIAGGDLSASGKGFVNHGATAGTARPTGYASIEWLGSVEPTNAEDVDTWIDTS